jgi:hypothetical protein
MRIRCSRLKLLLLPKGFHFSDFGGSKLTFFRQDSSVDLFQKVQVDCQGTNGEAVYGNVTVSVLKFLHLKIDIRNHLTDLDVDKERNWTIIEDSAQAKIWEEQFARIAPAFAEAHARRNGERLLQMTAQARNDASEVLQQIDSTKRLSQLIQEFQATRGRQLLNEAERLARWPGVMQVYDAEELYTVACCAILNSAQGPSFIGQDPLKSDMLMWQIQLVADRLLSRLKGAA